MKLRNKKTGKIEEFVCVQIIEKRKGKYDVFNAYKSLDQLNAEWEDCKPTEPLIKDEGIRKAIRAWAESNNVPIDAKLDVFEYLGTGITAIRYLYKAKTLPHERHVQFEYISSDEIYNSQNNRKYTIEELCEERGRQCQKLKK